MTLSSALTPTEWALVVSAFAALLTVLYGALRRNGGPPAGTVLIDPAHGSGVLIEGAVRAMVYALNEKEAELEEMRRERDSLRAQLEARDAPPSSP